MGSAIVAYFIVFHVMRWRRDRAEARYRQRLSGEEPRRSARDILRRCYRNLADTIVEAFWGFGASADALKARVKFEDAELIQRAIDRKQTILLLAAHHGNWEWLLLAAGAYFPIPIDVVYQPQRLASLDEFLRDVRCRFGGKLIPRKEFVYELLSHAGEPRAYALIADQTPRKEDPKHWTRFLRQDTAFFVGAGKIAKFLESPVYFVSMKRERRGHYTVRLDVLAEPPYEDLDDAVIVERYARCLESAIVESPADWLWLQKKWKYAKPVPGEEKGRTRKAFRPALALTWTAEVRRMPQRNRGEIPAGDVDGKQAPAPRRVGRRAVDQVQARVRARYRASRNGADSASPVALLIASLHVHRRSSARRAFVGARSRRALACSSARHELARDARRR